MTEQEWISEEIIFDYLEGNLSVEEREGFELLMDESEMITHEVKLWKNAYVNEPLPNVEALENSLIIKSSAIGTNQLKRFLSTIAFVLLLTSPSANHYEFSEEQGMTIAILKKEQMYSTVLNDSDCVAIPNVAVDEKIYREEEREAEELVPLKHYKTVRSNRLLSKPLVLKEIQIREIPFVQIRLVTTSLLAKKKTIRKSWSLNAQKRKNEMENVAAKFLSGREPYVVPLKSTNF